MNEERIASGSMNDDFQLSQTAQRQRRHGRLLAKTQLTTIFNYIVDQPTPEEFLDLLRRIDAHCAPG